MQYIVFYWGCQTGRHPVYQGIDPSEAKHEMNVLRRHLHELLPDERIIEIVLEIDGKVEEWADLIRPWCDHCGHIVQEPVKRWKETKTFLCPMHTEEMLSTIV